MAKHIKINQLNLRVDVGTMTETPYGSFSLKREFTLVATRWAHRVDYTGVAERGYRGLDPDLTHRFYFRNQSLAVDATNVLREGSKIYRVLSVKPVSTERNGTDLEFLQVDTRYVGADTAFDNTSPETPL